MRKHLIDRSTGHSSAARNREGDVFAKKSLGQHFLRSGAALKAMCEAGKVVSGDVVLEIGPGEGVLTAELLAHGAQVVAIEKDTRLLPVLRERFAQEIAKGQLHLIESDALIFDPNSIQGSYKLIANIPYYITGALLQHFLSSPHQPSTLVFLVQKEIAERIAKSKKESLLSLSVKVYGTPRYVKTVPRGAFVPAPKVDSAILAVEGVSRARFASAGHESRFFTLLRAGFAHKRKLLARNLESEFGGQTQTAEAFTTAGIPLKARAEDVPLEKWLAIARV